MDFWKHLAEGKGLFLPEELELPFEDMVKTRNKVSGQEPETRYDTSNCPFLSSQGTLGGPELIEVAFPDTLRRARQSHCHDPTGDALTDQIGIDYYREVASPTCTSTNVVSQEKQLGSRMVGSFVESDGLELATIDLKLGGLADSTGARDGESSKDAPSVHSSMPSMPTKRTRLTSLYSQTPTCQVHGCNKDLSSSKDYYKRHKVCDSHTKTAKVIVKGIEQRFCQQCSRFHLLAEFDDGKRSCRKRLANHNERRRKPPGTRFLSSSIRRTSFLFQEMLPPAFSCPSRHESGKWFGRMKFEDPYSDTNSLLSFHDNDSVETIDKTVGVVVPSDQEFSHIPDSSCALSLLSRQSLKAPDQLLGTAISSPMAATLSHHNYISAQGLTCSSTNSEKIGPSGPYLAEKAGHVSTISPDAVGAGLKAPEGGIVTGSNTSNSKYYLSSGQSNMVDLLQLSSHLQMVEHKRNSCTEEVQYHLA